MTHKLTLNNWDPSRETLDANPILSCVKGKGWRKGSLERVISAISSHIRPFQGVDKENAAQLGKVICKKEAGPLEKKVLGQILKHIHGSKLFNGDNFQSLLELAHQFAPHFPLSRALYLLAKTPPEKRDQLVHIQQQLKRGSTGTPKLSLEWEPEEWLKIDSSWLNDIHQKPLENREKAIACLLKDPSLLSTVSQLKSLFGGYVLNIDTEKKELIEDLVWRKPANLEKIQALPKSQRAKHLQKIHALGVQSGEQLQRLLTVPPAQFDKSVKQAKSWVDKSTPYEQIERVIALGSLPLDRQQEAIDLALTLHRKEPAFPLSKTLHLVGQTPLQSRERLLSLFTELTTTSEYNKFLKELPAKEWLKIEDRWLPYLKELDPQERVLTLELLVEKNVFSFVEWLKPLLGARLRVVKLLHKCTSDAERNALIEATSLLSILRQHQSRVLNLLETTDIPFKELPTHVRILKESFDEPEFLIPILKGFNKNEPDYFKKALAFFKGLNTEETVDLAWNISNYSYPHYVGLFDLTLPLIDEKMPWEDRDELLHSLARCEKKDRNKVVERVKRFHIKKGIGEAITLILKSPNYCSFVIELLNPLNTSDTIKVALLKILTRRYKQEECSRAIPLLLNLLSDDLTLKPISSNLNVTLETLSAYSELLKDISPPPLKMALLAVILNQADYKELLPLLIRLTEGINVPDDLAFFAELRTASRKEVIKLVLEVTPSKDFRFALIKTTRYLDFNSAKKVIQFISNTLKGSEHLFAPVVKFIDTLSMKVEICAILEPTLATASMESKLQLFKELKELNLLHLPLEPFLKWIKYQNKKDPVSFLRQCMQDITVIRDTLPLNGCIEFLAKLGPLLEGKTGEERLIFLKQQASYTRVYDRLPEEIRTHGAPIIKRWFDSTYENIEALRDALIGLPSNLSNTSWREVLSSKLHQGKDGAKKAPFIHRLKYILYTLRIIKNEKVIRQLFMTTHTNFKSLFDALTNAMLKLTGDQLATLLSLDLRGQPDGDIKATTIDQRIVFIKLKDKFPDNAPLLSALVFNTTTHIEELLSLESVEFLKEGLPFMEGIKDGEARLDILKAIKEVVPELRPQVLQEAKARLSETQNRKALIQQQHYYLRILKERTLSEKGKLNLRQLLSTNHLDYKTIQNSSEDFIMVLLAEALAYENRDYKKLNELVDTFFTQLNLYLPLIFERPFLVHYLIRHRYYEMQEAIEGHTYPPQIQSLLIPFLKPSQIMEMVLDKESLKRPVLSGERSWLTPASAFQELQKTPNINLILSEFGEEGFIQAIPFAALALLAKNKPELLLPYLTYFGDLQLAATLPFLDPEKVAQETLSLPKMIVIAKRAPVKLKELLVARITPTPNSLQIQQIETFYKACQEGDPYLIPIAKQEELQAAKKALESEVDASPNFDIPPRYQDCTTFEVMTDPIRLPSNGKYVDRTTFDRFEKNGDQVKNIDNLFYPSKNYTPDTKLKEELKCIDKYTGRVMEKPLKVPPDYTLHIDASLLDQLEKNEKGVKSPFDLKFYPEDSFLPDPELEEWMNDY